MCFYIRFFKKTLFFPNEILIYPCTHKNGQKRTTSFNNTATNRIVFKRQLYHCHLAIFEIFLYLCVAYFRSIPFKKSILFYV